VIVHTTNDDDQLMNKMKGFCGGKKKVSLKWKYQMTLHATGIEIQNSWLNFVLNLIQI